MKSLLNDNAGHIVLRSLPLLEHHRKELQAAMRRYMGRCAPPDRSPQDHHVVGPVIMDMLFDHAREAGGGRPLVRIAETARQHRRHRLTAQHYSCFGDGLGAVLKDVLGGKASPPVVWAWGDTYWTIVRATLQEDLLLAA